MDVFDNIVFDCLVFDTTCGTAPSIVYGGGGNYDGHLQRAKAWRDERDRKLAENQANIKRAEKRIERIELSRVNDLADQALQLRLISAMRELEALEIYRQKLMVEYQRWIDDEETALILLLTIH